MPPASVASLPEGDMTINKIDSLDELHTKPTMENPVKKKARTEKGTYGLALVLYRCVESESRAQCVGNGILVLHFIVSTNCVALIYFSPRQ